MSNPNIPKNKKSFNNIYKIISSLDIGQSCYNQLRSVQKSNLRTGNDHNFGDEGAGDEDELLRRMLEGSDKGEVVKKVQRQMLLVVDDVEYCFEGVIFFMMAHFRFR